MHERDPSLKRLQQEQHQFGEGDAQHQNQSSSGDSFGGARRKTSVYKLGNSESSTSEDGPRSAAAMAAAAANGAAEGPGGIGSYLSRKEFGNLEGGGAGGGAGGAGGSVLPGIMDSGYASHGSGAGGGGGAYPKMQLPVSTLYTNFKPTRNFDSLDTRAADAVSHRGFHYVCGPRLPRPPPAGGL